MKIQPVEFPLEIGTADELRIVVDKGVAYYNLVDTSKTSVMPNGTEFGFKLLYSDRLKLEDNESDAESLIVNLLGVTLIN
jgi:hypothetical protein